MNVARMASEPTAPRPTQAGYHHHRGGGGGAGGAQRVSGGGGSWERSTTESYKRMNHGTTRTLGYRSPVPDPPTVPDRLVRLEGARNFRDLGGYRGAGGRIVRYGCIFRSGELTTLTPADRAVVAALGIVTICDLRGPGEVDRMPDGPIAGAEPVALPMGEGDADHGNMIDRVARAEIEGVTEADMAQIYVSLLDRFPSEIGAVLSLAADPDRHALLFHCAAGKDRTGLVAALLLAALGVSQDDILDDFELTNRYRSAWRIAQLRPELADRGVDIDVMTAYFSAPRPAMAHALATLEARHGSVEGFLTGPGGVAPPTLEALREHLLER